MEVKVAAAQYPIAEHKTFEKWRLHIGLWVAEAAQQGAQLLLFPEYGSLELLGLLPDGKERNVGEELQALDSFRSDFCQVFADLAKKHQLVIVAPSFPVQEEEKTFNRAYVFSAGGLRGFQDKFFMTRFEKEEWGIQGAPKVLSLFEADWGSFGIQICYDVEFALGSKMLSSAGASLILAPSCTETIRGSSRVHIGARARALETQAYAIISQTVEEAPWSPAVGENYGNAAFYCAPALDMPEKGILNKMEPQIQGWLIQSLDLSRIQALRNEAKVFNFKDHQRFYTEFPDEEVQLVRRQL